MAFLAQHPRKGTSQTRLKHGSQLPSILQVAARIPLPTWLLLLCLAAAMPLTSNWANQMEIKLFTARNNRQAEYLCQEGDLERCRSLSKVEAPN